MVFSPEKERWISILQKNPSLVKKLIPKLTKYIIHRPYPKQLLFLLLDCKEAFYGGAAGGGKSDALLMGALQYVDIPGYSAIIFRKTFTDLKLPGALIARSFEWLLDSDAVWNSQTHTWHFPSGATISFGYLDSENAKERYRSSEFQYVAFDEVTQFNEDDYTFLFSRLRRLKSLKEIGIPIRMRSASNPGGVGHLWVKNRFKIKRDGRGHDPKRPFIPAKVSDNIALDVEEYREALKELSDPVARAQMLSGDWEISEDARIKLEWFKYYSVNATYYILGKFLNGKAVPKRHCRVFSTVDPAASVKEGPGDASIWKRMPSSTVIETWAVTPDFDLLLLDVYRGMIEIPDIIPVMKRINKIWKPDFFGIEANGLGIGVYQLAHRSNLTVRNLQTLSNDKLVRATNVLNRMADGRVYFPQEAVWLEQFEAELLSWTGHPHQQADQIDAMAWAGIIVSNEDSEFALDSPFVYS